MYENKNNTSKKYSKPHKVDIVRVHLRDSTFKGDFKDVR